MIKLTAIGHIGKDCVVNSVNGKTVINFNVAHTEKWKGADGNIYNKTTWVNCSWWTDRTGIVPYLLKGTHVYVEGTPDSDAYMGSDGQPKSNLRLRVMTLQLLSSKKEEGGQGQNRQPAPSQSTGWTPHQGQSSGDGFDANSITEPIDDLPF